MQPKNVYKNKKDLIINIKERKKQEEEVETERFNKQTSKTNGIHSSIFLIVFEERKQTAVIVAALKQQQLLLTFQGRHFV